MVHQGVDKDIDKKLHKVIWMTDTLTSHTKSHRISGQRWRNGYTNYDEGLV